MTRCIEMVFPVASRDGTRLRSTIRSTILEKWKGRDEKKKRARTRLLDIVTLPLRFSPPIPISLGRIPWKKRGLEKRRRLVFFWSRVNRRGWTMKGNRWSARERERERSSGRRATASKGSEKSFVAISAIRGCRGSYILGENLHPVNEHETIRVRNAFARGHRLVTTPTHVNETNTY